MVGSRPCNKLSRDLNVSSFREDPGNLGKQGSQESRKKEKSKSERPSSLNEPPILTRIEELVRKAEGVSPTHEQVVRELEKLIEQEASTASGLAAQSSTSAGGGEGASRKALLRLWGFPWDAEGVRVVSVTSISGQFHENSAKYIVVAQSLEERQKAEQWWRALEVVAPTTWITFNEGKEDVLVEGERGPAQVSCSIVCENDNAPRRGALPSTMKDGTEEVMGAPMKDIAAYRITIAKEFADEGIVARAEDRAESTPALVLPEALQKLVLRTRGAINYSDAITCVVTVRGNHKETFNRVQPAIGLFVAPQVAATLPKFIRQLEEEQPKEYCARVEALRVQCGGALVYNPRKASARIGTVQRDLPVPSGSAEATKWILKKTQSLDGPNCCAQVGRRLRVCQTVRSHEAWRKSVVVPGGGCRDGAIVQVYFWNHSSGRDERQIIRTQADQPRKVSSAWGVPKPKQEDDEENESSVRPREIRVPGAKPQEGQGTGSCEDEAMRAGGGEWKTVSAAKRRKGEAAPYHECFEEIDAGAGGDCFFLACAAGLNDKSGYEGHE